MLFSLTVFRGTALTINPFLLYHLLVFISRDKNAMSKYCHNGTPQHIRIHMSLRHKDTNKNVNMHLTVITSLVLVNL